MKDQKVTSLIANREMYKSSRKSSSKVNEVKGNIKNNVKHQGDKSDNKRTCFKCGEEGHFKSSCKKQVSCDVCNTDSHSNETFFSQKGKVNKSNAKGEKKKKKRKKSRGRKTVSKEDSDSSDSEQ